MDIGLGTEDTSYLRHGRLLVPQSAVWLSADEQLLYGLVTSARRRRSARPFSVGVAA